MAQNNAPPFKNVTRRNRTPLSDVPLTTAGGFVRTDLPQVGYAAFLWLRVFGTITTGVGAAGNYSNYFPYNLLSSLVLRSNEGLEIYRTSGYGNMLVQSVMNDAYNPMQTSAPVNAGVPVSGFGMKTAVSVSPAPNSALVASTVYPINVLYMIPIATDYQLTAGLLLLQNQATRASLEVSVNNLVGNGGINGILNAAGVLGTAGAINLTMRGSMEWFSVPPMPGSQPDLTFVHRWIEDNTTWTAAGDIIYKVPVNGIISRVISDYENNGAQYQWFGTTANPNTPQFGQHKVIYAASQSPEIEDTGLALARQRWYYSQDLPDGVVVDDFSYGKATPAVWDGRDVYDTAQLTEFAIVQNLTASPTTGKVRYIRQELQRRTA
jgi:hypothetical protein